MKINYEGTFPQAPDMPLRARLGGSTFLGQSARIGLVSIRQMECGL